MRRLPLLVFATFAALTVSCIAPVDRRPGLALPGEVAPAPPDWRFTDAIREIAIQVRTPYLVPHSVTIWCAAIEGDLYVGARDPDTKNWPGWVVERPDVRLGIDGRLYDGRLERVTASEERTRVEVAYAEKYQSGGRLANVRFWRFVPDR